MVIDLFFTFFKVGAFTIGGGYAMLPVIQGEVVEKKKWMKEEEFLDAIALTNSLPGPLATNCATFVGYRLAGFPGAISSVLGAIMPSFLIILAIALFFTSISGYAVTHYIFSGVRPAVVALIFFALVKMVKSVGVNAINTIIAVSSLVLLLFFNIHPIFVITISGVIGLFLFSRNSKATEGRK